MVKSGPAWFSPFYILPLPDQFNTDFAFECKQIDLFFFVPRGKSLDLELETDHQKQNNVCKVIM